MPNYFHINFSLLFSAQRLLLFALKLIKRFRCCCQSYSLRFLVTYQMYFNDNCNKIRAWTTKYAPTLPQTIFIIEFIIAALIRYTVTRANTKNRNFLEKHNVFGHNSGCGVEYRPFLLLSFYNQKNSTSIILVHIILYDI